MILIGGVKAPTLLSKMKKLDNDFKVTTEIPKALNDYYAPFGFYVVINRYYTATVRNVLELKNYINNDVGQIDMDFFGKVTSEDSEAGDDFVGVLYRILAEVMDFKTFNDGFRHQFIECETGLETISIRTKGGKYITLAVMEKYGQCVDIKLHNRKGKDNDRFQIIGFDEGQTPVPHTDLTLMTILLDK